MAENEEEEERQQQPPPPPATSARPPQPSRPTITLPPRTSFESLFNNSGAGGNTGFSPGPMTLVSSFFSDGEDCKSFSQLLAGAMLPPADRAGFPQLEDRNSGDDNNSGFRFKQNEAAGLSLGPLSPMFPAGFLDSPGALFSPGQGAFGMTHQQALAQVTAQASQSQSYSFHIPNEHSTSMTQLPIFSSSTTPPQDMPSGIPDFGVSVKESSDISHSDQRSQPSSLTVDKPNDDGYNWRKYGQKQVKGSEFPRSYYKCTHPSCPVKKKVERSVDGQITEIIYKGEHNHQHPVSKRPKDSGNQNGNVQVNHDLASQGHGGNSNKSKEGTYSMSRQGQESSQAISGTSDSEEVGDAETKVEEKDEDEPEAKRRNMEVRHSEPASSHRTVTEPRIIVQTTSEVDLLDDGYRWRKYGQKVVKGNPYPRSYYKCTFEGCNVRKHVERAATDPKAVITTYEGKHNHDVPASKSGSRYAANNKASIPGTEKHASVSKMETRNNDKQPVARLRLKEEKIT
ncbi:probable WRKY transcription factor 3 [Argentina anserina]|uniref:probable WRKY transcription factor 3 n=1 Tax=Argentina anserina TaxID=57926 RepID=UPI002176613D|nr:probable WRKY transcription factor 3 [Potentilla anserina]